MPLIMPDSTGRAAQLWLWCGMLKCMGFIALLTWALYTKTPRECLYYMEWGCMVVAVGIGFFTMASTYCVMLDMPEGSAPENFVRDWIITGVFVCFLGYLCVSGFPRRAGKSLLQRMPGLGGDAGSYEHQSLAATIAIMIGADTGFRKIMESAMGDFYAGEMRGEGKTPPRPCGRPQFSSCKICPDRLGTNARKLKTNLALGFSLARAQCRWRTSPGTNSRRTTPTRTVSRRLRRFSLKRWIFSSRTPGRTIHRPSGMPCRYAFNFNRSF